MQIIPMNNERKCPGSYGDAVRHRILVASAVISLTSLAACGSEPAGPGSPSSDRQLAGFTEWVKTQPELKQGGDLFYDELDRLVRYEFWGTLPDGTRRTTIAETYAYDGDRLVTAELSIRLPDDVWRLTRHVTFAHDDRGRVVQADAEESDENGGVRFITYRLEYTPSGEVAMMRVGDDQEIEYSYDADGNVVRVEARHLSRTVHTFAHDATVNPLRSLPLLASINLLGVWDRYSRHNSVRMESGEVGKDPVAFGSGLTEADAAGYPVRKEWTMWNASDPIESRMEFVTTYAYR